MRYSSLTWSWIVTSFVISYVFAPEGTRTSTRVALLVAEEALADGRGRRDAADGGVGVLGDDDLVDDLVARVLVLQRDHRAEPDLVARDPVEVHEGERGEPPVQLRDARLQEALPLLGALVLGVLAEVPVLARPQDLLRQGDLELVVELVDLVLEPLLDVDHLLFGETSPERASGSVILSRLSARWPRPRSCKAARTRSTSGSGRSRTAVPAPSSCLLEGPEARPRGARGGAARRRGGGGPAGREDRRRACAPSRPCAARGATGAPAQRGPARRRSPRRRPRRDCSPSPSGPSFDEERVFGGTPLVLVADAVQNPGNLGGLLRTAEAAGASGRVPDRRHAPTRSRGRRCAARWAARSASPTRAAARSTRCSTLLERRGVAVVATAADGERRYDEADLRGPVALVVGSEGAGLPAAVLSPRRRRGCASRCRPPVESLNVGVAAALVLFEAARQRGFAAAGVPR